MKHFPKSLSPFFVIGLVLVIIINIGTTVWSARDKYISQDLAQRYPQLKFAYEDSQYANKNFTSWIPDEPVNTYAGLAYVKGVNPILIAADTPPLGRYLIGITGTIFNNENIITLLVGILGFFFLYLLGTQLFNSRIIALIPPALLSFEPLIKNQFIYTPLLDLMQMFFLLAYFYVFNIALIKKKNYLRYFIIANILLGCFISVKFFATGVTIIAASLGVLLLHFEKKKLFSYLLTLPLSIIVLFLSYSRAFIDNPNIKSFVGIQKWVFLYHKSQLTTPFAIWPFIYLNEWHVWWGNKPILSEITWTFLWPVTTTMTFLTSFFHFTKKIPMKKEVEVLMLWVIIYFLFFSFGQITARYLVILLPVLYLVSIYGIVNLIPLFNKYNSKKR